MKKVIAISLSVTSIIICCYLIVIKTSSLDIPSNKNEWYVMDAVHKIEDQTDIDDCEKKVLITNIKTKRQNDIDISNDAFETQLLAFGIISIQIILMILIFLMPSRLEKKNNKL